MVTKARTLFLVAVMLLLASSIAVGEEEKDTRFGIGFQGSFPAWGISGVADLNESVAIQGVFGMFGDLKTYAGRGILRFSKGTYWNTYGYGMGGVWTYTGYEFDDDWTLRETTQTVPGFGAGVGLEYDWRAWSPNMPPVRWNLEIGFARVEFDEVDYDFSSLMVGAGLHFRF